MPSFSDILDSLDDTSNQVELTGDWAQGRTIFGGLVAALAVRALRRQLGHEAPLRSLLVQFAGPVEPGIRCIAARVTRTGRSASHGMAQVPGGDGDVRCTVLASFGHARTSAITVAAPPRPEAPEPSAATELPFIEGVTPEFTRHLEYRWAVGDLPFSRSPRAELGGYCRFRQPQRASAEELAVALADAWPPPILPVLARPAPASSMTWSLDLADLEEQAARADAWWFFRSRAAFAGGGYAHVEQSLWDPRGHAIALGTQMAAVFDSASTRG